MSTSHRRQRRRRNDDWERPDPDDTNTNSRGRGADDIFSMMPSMTDSDLENDSDERRADDEHVIDPVLERARRRAMGLPLGNNLPAQTADTAAAATATNPQVRSSDAGWSAIPLDTGIFRDYYTDYGTRSLIRRPPPVGDEDGSSSDGRRVRRRTDHHDHDSYDEDEEYCAACNTNIRGVYPRIEDKYIKMINDTIMNGMRDRNFNAMYHKVHYKWNFVIRPLINKVCRVGGKGSIQYEELPEWTIVSIKIHVWSHMNDTYVFNMRNAFKIDALGDAIGKWGTLKEHDTIRGPGNRLLRKVDLSAAKAAIMAWDRSSNRITITSKVLMNKSGDNDASSRIYYANPARTVDRLYSDLCYVKRRNI